MTAACTSCGSTGDCDPACEVEYHRRRRRRPTVTGSLRVDAYAVLDRAVEEGVALGLRRAHKHTDTPTEAEVAEHVHREVMAAIGEVFRFESPP